MDLQGNFLTQKVSQVRCITIGVFQREGKVWRNLLKITSLLYFFAHAEIRCPICFHVNSGIPWYKNSGLIFCSLVFVTKVKCDLIKIEFLFPCFSTSSYPHFELKSSKSQLLNSLSLQYRLPEQISKSNERRRKNCLVYPIVFNRFDMTLLVLHIFIPYLSTSYAASSLSLHPSPNALVSAVICLTHSACPQCRRAHLN